MTHGVPHRGLLYNSLNAHVIQAFQAGSRINAPQMYHGTAQIWACKAWPRCACSLSTEPVVPYLISLTSLVTACSVSPVIAGCTLQCVDSIDAYQQAIMDELQTTDMQNGLVIIVADIGGNLRTLKQRNTARRICKSFAVAQTIPGFSGLVYALVCISDLRAASVSRRLTQICLRRSSKCCLDPVASIAAVL